MRVTHDVWNCAVERLRVLSLLLEDVAVLSEETVRMVEAGHLELEVVVALWDTKHVLGIHSEVHTNGVSLNGVLGWLSLSLLVSCVGLLGLRLLVSIDECVLFEVLDNMWVFRIDLTLSNDILVDNSHILGIIIQVIVVIDNDSLVAVNILDDSEWVELDLVRYLVLSSNKDAVVENLHKVVHALLNLDLIPVNTNAGVGDRESFFLFRGLDLHLHDAVLEQSEMEVEMGSSELHVVLLIELIVVQMESAVDRVFVHNHGIWLDKVGAEGVIVLDAVVVLVLVVVSVMANQVLIVVLAKELAELVTELLLAADLPVL